MGLVYLASLLLGGGFLLVQLFLSGHDQGDLHGGDLHGGDLHAGDVHGGGDHAGHGDGHGHASAWLSPRFFTFTLFAFGFAGSALHYLGLAGPLVTFASSLVAGLGSGIGAVSVFQALSRRDSDSTAALAEASGQYAKVLLPCGPGQTGKVRVELRGQLVDILATCEEGPVEAGRSVVVVDVRGDVAKVVPAPEALEP